MTLSSVIAQGGDDSPPEQNVQDILKEMLMDKVRAVLGDPSEPCSPQAYLQTVIDLMLAGERIRDFMCSDATTLAKPAVEARLRQIFEESFGESYRQLSEFYHKQIQFTNTLIFTSVLHVHDQLVSGALQAEEYDRQIRSAVHFQLGRAGIEFAHALSGDDLKSGICKR